MPKLSKTYDDYDFLLAAGIAVYRWEYLGEESLGRSNERELAAEATADDVLFAFNQSRGLMTMALTKSILRYLYQPRYLPLTNVGFKSEAKEISNVGDHNRVKGALDFEKWATANLPKC